MSTRRRRQLTRKHATAAPWRSTRRNTPPWVAPMAMRSPTSRRRRPCTPSRSPSRSARPAAGGPRWWAAFSRLSRWNVPARATNAPRRLHHRAQGDRPHPRSRTPHRNGEAPFPCPARASPEGSRCGWFRFRLENAAVPAAPDREFGAIRGARGCQ